MDFLEFKRQSIKEQLAITDEFGTIFSFIDFGNVNKWFEKDRQDWNSRPLTDDQKISIDIQKLEEFADLFSQKVRCYYGKDPKNDGSKKFNYALEKTFGKHNFVSKDIQQVIHYLEDEVVDGSLTDKDGKEYIHIPKCNFDVEISVDVIRKIKKFDTCCLFSSDADFVYLNQFLKKMGKKVILIKGGYITSNLRKSADLVINAQTIKQHIAQIKTKT